MATAVAVITRPTTLQQASLWSDAWRRLRRNRLALVSAIYLALLVGVALFALVHTPYSYRSVGVAVPYSGPSSANWLGADILGRDVLSRLMVGAQISLIVGVGTQVLVLMVGIPIGLLSGYYKGPLDTVVSFIINVFYGIPDLLVAMILLLLLGPSLNNIIIAIVATRWMDMARLVRGPTLGMRERGFMEAARARASTTSSSRSSPPAGWTWHGWFAARRSPCASASSSRPPGLAGPSPPRSCSGTSSRTPWARSSCRPPSECPRPSCSRPSSASWGSVFSHRPRRGARWLGTPCPQSGSRRTW